VSEAGERSAGRGKGRTSDVPLFERTLELVPNYEQGPRWFIPGYDASHAIAAVLLRDRIGDRGRILVVGAGGGVELSVFSNECQGWSFVGVDPSDAMIALARRKLEAAGASARTEFVRGEIEAAPRERFDAATAFLALHFIPDDGRRLRALHEIHERLAPGAPFLLIDGCTEMGTERFEEDVRLYAAFALRSGAPRETVEGAVKMQRERVSLVSPAREEALLAEAGFKDVRSFYQGLWVFGWIATA
jgi:tRNA (cmo5U34)-methyltransferase